MHTPERERPGEWGWGSVPAETTPGHITEPQGRSKSSPACPPAGLHPDRNPWPASITYEITVNPGPQRFQWLRPGG